MATCPVGLFPYTIRSGDTLWQISQRYYTSTGAIMAANPGLNPRNLSVGQTICIPARRTPQPPAPTPPSGGTGGGNRCPVGLRSYTLQKNDTIWLLAQRYCTTVESIQAINPGLNPYNLYAGQTIWIPAGYQLPNIPFWFRSQAVTPGEPDSSGEMDACPRGYESYVIEEGDTIWMLSQRFQITADEIMASNPDLDPANLFAGLVICIPRRRNNMPKPTPQPMPRPVPEPAEPPIYLWVSKEEHNLSNYLRLLWSQHVYWARMAMQSMIQELPDTQAVADRLAQNPKDFEIALQVFYGEDLAEDIGNLLSKHISLGNDYITAAKTGDAAAAESMEKQLYQNADQMATLLGNINPKWSADEWKNMLHDHLALLKDDICSMLSGNFEDSISTFTDIERGALEMADIMALGIEKQFPHYFR